MKLSVIIVSWNVKDRLRDNLKSIFAADNNFGFEIYVVDNASSDGSAEMVEKEFPQVILIKNQDNFGFAKANNQAIKLCAKHSDFILLLNPDMKVYPDTLSNMIDWMEKNTQAGVAGCYLANENGETVKHVRRFPTWLDQLAIILKLPHFFPGVLKAYLRDDFNYSKPAKVDSVRGGFFMLRNSTIEKIGQLDESYFVWFEEVDYCKRVREGGMEVWYTPVARCIDYFGQSFKQVKRGKTQKYFRDSMLKYFRKWHPGWQYWVLRVAWPIGISLAACGEVLKIRNKAKT